MKLLARRPLFFLAWTPLLLSVSGCASQKEGERCDPLNQNLDCEDGLVCRRVYLTTFSSICCPPLSAQVTVATCNLGSAPNPDAGATDAGTTDAGSDTDASDDTNGNAPDAGSDAAAEASNDRSTFDTSNDVSVDTSLDMSTRDNRADTATQDAPDDASSLPDSASPDAPIDNASLDTISTDVIPDTNDDVVNDATLDVMTPIDASDAATADGPG